MALVYPITCAIAWCRRPRFFSCVVRVGCSNTIPMRRVCQMVIPTTWCYVCLPSVQHVINNIMNIGWYVKRLNGTRTNTDITRPINNSRPAFKTMADALSFNDSREWIFITLWFRSGESSVVIVTDPAGVKRDAKRAYKWLCPSSFVKSSVNCVMHSYNLASWYKTSWSKHFIYRADISHVIWIVSGISYLLKGQLDQWILLILNK